MIKGVSSFKDHSYLVVDSKIAYKEDDRISDSLNYGYPTVFANFHEYERRLISQESFVKSQEISLTVSEFSYALLPKHFNYILGVTGTLQEMSEFQKRSLSNNYKVNEAFILPSVYGASRRT